MPIIRKISSRVASARNPQEGLAAIADGIDQIIEMLQSAPKADAWGEWVDPATERRAAVGSRPTREGELELTNLRAAINAAHDPEDRSALEAKLRLLTDKGRSGFEEDRGRSVTQVENTDGTIIDVAAVSVERQIARATWATMVGLEQYLEPVDDAWTSQQAAEAFAKGGPMWLYLGNRAGVMRMPMGDRSWLVNEAEKDSRTDAHELSRDILKSSESADSNIAAERASAA